MNVGSGGGAAAAPSGGAAGGATSDAPAEEAKKEEKEEGKPNNIDIQCLFADTFSLNRKGGIRRGYGLWALRLNILYRTANYRNSDLYLIHKRDCT